MRIEQTVGSLAVLFSLACCTTPAEIASPAVAETNIQKAEFLIDAFYSFDSSRLTPLLESAGDSASSIIYYQGWADGGNYKILDRQPCRLIDSDRVQCSITVEDDPMLALGSDFKVTDTFDITFDGNEILSVETSSNDQQIYYDARDWVRANLPELLEIPCEGFFDGGPTPGECAKAMAEGYAEFAASDEFPGA
jgi:hypothetical protein